MKEKNQYYDVKGRGREYVMNSANISTAIVRKHYERNTEKDSNRWVLFSFLETAYKLNAILFWKLVFWTVLQELFHVLLPYFHTRLLNYAASLAHFNTNEVPSMVYNTVTGYIPEALILITFCAGCFIGQMLQRYVEFRREQVSFKIAIDAEDAWRYAFLDNFYKNSMSWHTDQTNGQIGLVEKAGWGWGLLNQTISENIIMQGFQIMFVSIALLCKSFYFFFVLCLSIPLFYGLSKYMWQKIKLVCKAEDKRWNNANKVLYDSGGNVNTVKIYGTEEEEVVSYGFEQDSAHKLEEIEIYYWFLQTFGDSTITEIIKTIFVISCLSGLQNGTISVGDVVLSLSWLSLFTTPLQNLGKISSEIQKRTAKIQKVAKVIAVDAQLKYGTAQMQPLVDGIELVDVSFEYGNSNIVNDQAEESRAEEDTSGSSSEITNLPTKTLNHISLKIPALKTTAIVGKSGCGKSTLISLLLRLYDPTEGAILYDGRDLRAFTAQSMRKNMVVVSQQTELFDRTIAENVKYGTENATMEEVESACRQAHAHEFIISTPNKYDSKIGSDGVKLSGGQRQRLSIARALLKRPSLLIFDESTSSLDSESEIAIQKSITELQHSMTIIIISHRLATVRDADNIIVMQNRAVSAVGNHEYLIQNSVLYRKLYTLQCRSKAS